MRFLAGLGILLAFLAGAVIPLSRSEGLSAGESPGVTVTLPAQSATLTDALGTRAESSAQIAAVAYSWMAHHIRGTLYAMGGTGPRAWDCSGAVQAAYRAAGISLPRTTYGMLADRALHPVRDPVPGDLAFYGAGHVELYAGPGRTIGAHDYGQLNGFARYGYGWVPTEFMAYG